MAEISSRVSTALADRYRIEQRLGQGGMATVYLAQDLKHDRKVAVKVLRPELAAVLGADRFIREIKTTANLQHPHILPLFDSGEADSFLYYVMPYIEGETLGDKLDRETQLSIDEAVRIATEVADALDYAHRHNVIHRDIKPENILLHDGRPMVADFGIALAVSAAAGGRMTETGMSLGTPHYMSPEQATADKDLTARSDIYSLGSVLYEMLTGDPPHTGSSAQQIIMKIVTDDVKPVTQTRKSVPPNVAAAVEKALEKLPADRFGTAKAFAEALSDGTFTSPGVAAPAGAFDATTRGPAWRVVTAAAGVALLAGIVAGWMLRPVPERPLRPVQFFIKSDSLHLISTAAGVALSPDGMVLVYGASTGSGSMLYRRRIDELEPQPIPGTENAHSPFFSPDGTEIGFEDPAYGGVRSLRRVRLDGSPPRTITAGYEGNVLGADWRDDGRIVFSTWLPSHVYTVNADGGPAAFLEPLESVADSVPIAGPIFVDDDAIAFASWGLDTRIGVVSLRSEVVRWLMPGSGPHYLASGQLLYVGDDGSLFAQPFDVAKLDTAGTARRIAEGLAFGLGGETVLAVSSSGTTITYGMAGSEGRDLVLVDRQGKEQVLLQDGGFWVPRFSPDGRRIVYGQTGGDEDIWIHDIVRNTTTRLTLDGLGNNDPVVEPRRQERRVFPLLQRQGSLRALHNRGDPQSPRCREWNAVD
jgi:serine/threonine-protein kinase